MKSKPAKVKLVDRVLIWFEGVMRNLTSSGFAIALLIVIAGIIILIGQLFGFNLISQLNYKLSSDSTIFNMPLYDDNLIRSFGMVDQYSRGITAFMVISGLLFVVAMVALLYGGLSKLGQFVIAMVSGRAKQVTAKLYAGLVGGTWAMVILLTWLIVNTDITLYLLLTELAMLLLNLFCLFISIKLAIKVDKLYRSGYDI